MSAITDRVIEREQIIVMEKEKGFRQARIQHWVWHDGFAHAVFHGIDAQAQARTYKKEKGGRGELTQVSRTNHIPPAALVATWEAEGHKKGSKAAVAFKFGFSAFDPKTLKEYAAACYDAVNKALRAKGNKPFAGMAKLVDGGVVRGLQVTGDLSVDVLNSEIGIVDEADEADEAASPEAASPEAPLTQDEEAILAALVAEEAATKVKGKKGK